MMSRGEMTREDGLALQGVEGVRRRGRSMGQRVHRGEVNGVGVGSVIERIVGNLAEIGMLEVLEVAGLGTKWRGREGVGGGVDCEWGGLVGVVGGGMGE